MEAAGFFSHEKVAVLRENRNGFYGIGSYLFAKVIVDLPFQIFNPLIFVAILAPMSSLKTDAESFFTLWAILFLLAVNSQK